MLSDMWLNCMDTEGDYFDYWCCSLFEPIW
jgi:hypothetical protein